MAITSCRRQPIPPASARRRGGCAGARGVPRGKSLATSQRQGATGDRNGDVHRRQRRANVRWHVIVSFGRVMEQGVSVRRQTREETLQVPAHFRVSVLLNQQRRGCMTEV